MSALELGLQALGVGRGMRVLLPALTFPATALAVMRCGAVPVFGDVCPRRWTLTPAIAVAALERELFDLVMPVATFGQSLPHGDWDQFVASTKVPVLADAAAALGVQAIGRLVHWTFSLHATKPMGIGEGGLFVSADAAVTERVRRLANFGFDAGIVRLEGGTNAKLS
jgi:dTDP-4-amino-4,6-dideoxygalactose transaminase